MAQDGDLESMAVEAGVVGAGVKPPTWTARAAQPWLGVRSRPGGGAGSAVHASCGSCGCTLAGCLVWWVAIGDGLALRFAHCVSGVDSCRVVAGVSAPIPWVGVASIKVGAGVMCVSSAA